MKDKAKTAVPLRQCKGCGEWKPASAYYPFVRGDRAYWRSRCRRCTHAETAARQKADPVRNRAYAKKSADKARREALQHYSNGRFRCACCGDSHYEFLCLDHTQGGGTKARKHWDPEAKTQRTLFGNRYYFALRQSGYPPGLRVLCHNCNMAIGMYGACPHKGGRKEWASG